MMIKELCPDKLMVLDTPVLYSKRHKTKFGNISMEMIKSVANWEVKMVVDIMIQ